MSQVPTKGRKVSRRAKPSTKALGEEVMNERAEKEPAPVKKAEKGKTALKERAPKRITLKKTKDTYPVETGPKEMSPQVKTPGDADPEKMPLSLSNMAEVPVKGRKGSRAAKTFTTALKETAGKKMTLKESTEIERVLMEGDDKTKSEKGKAVSKRTALKNTTAKRNANKNLAPDEDPQDVAPEETVQEGLVSGELPPKIKALNMAQVLDTRLEESSTVKESTTALRKRALKKTALGETGEKEAAQIEANEKGKTSRKKGSAPKRGTAKNTAQMELGHDEITSPVKSLDGNVLEKMASKIQPKKVETSPQETAPKLRATRLKAPKRTASKKAADLEIPGEVTVKATVVTKTRTSKLKVPNKTSSQKKELNKEKAVQEMAAGENALKEEIGLKKSLREAVKKGTAVKNKTKQETRPEETVPEKRALKEVDEVMTSTKPVQKKTAAKFKAPKSRPEEETETRKEKESRKRTSKGKAPKAEKNPSQDEVHSVRNF